MAEQDELHAALEARRELGPEYEPQVVDSFLERVERRLAERRDNKPARPEANKTLALAIISLILSIPLTAIGVTQAGLTGLVVVWAGIVLVNLAYTQRR